MNPSVSDNIQNSSCLWFSCKVRPCKGDVKINGSLKQLMGQHNALWGEILISGVKFDNRDQPKLKIEYI
jgi:hypothetical protein